MFLKINIYILLLLNLWVMPAAVRAQSRVINKDTVAQLRMHLLGFLAAHMDSLNSANFTIFKKEKLHTIYYGTFKEQYAERICQYLIHQTPPFQAFLKSGKGDSSFCHWNSKKTPITFTIDSKSKAKKQPLILTIFPPVKMEQFIYLQVIALSPGYEDDMNGTYLYFCFDAQLNIVGFRQSEAIY